MLTKGNPALCLRYPEGRQKENWWGMVECLYTAFAAATLRWSLTEGAASHKSETKSWKYSTMAIFIPLNSGNK